MHSASSPKSHTQFFWKKKLRLSRFGVKKCQKWQEKESALFEYEVRVRRLPAISEILEKSAEAAGFFGSFWTCSQKERRRTMKWAGKGTYQHQTWENGLPRACRREPHYLRKKHNIHVILTFAQSLNTPTKPFSRILPWSHTPDFKVKFC